MLLQLQCLDGKGKSWKNGLVWSCAGSRCRVKRAGPVVLVDRDISASSTPHETLKFSIIVCLSLQKAIGKLQYIYNSCISRQRSV